MHAPEINQILHLSAVAASAIGGIATSNEKKIKIIELLLSSVYNRGLAEALVAAVSDDLTQGEGLHRAQLLAELATHEARQAMHQIEELCK